MDPFKQTRSAASSTNESFGSYQHPPNQATRAESMQESQEVTESSSQPSSFIMVTYSAVNVPILAPRPRRPSPVSRMEEQVKQLESTTEDEWDMFDDAEATREMEQRMFEQEKQLDAMVQVEQWVYGVAQAALVSEQHINNLVWQVEGIAGVQQEIYAAAMVTLYLQKHPDELTDLWLRPNREIIDLRPDPRIWGAEVVRQMQVVPASLRNTAWYQSRFPDNQTYLPQQEQDAMALWD